MGIGALQRGEKEREREGESECVRERVKETTRFGRLPRRVQTAEWRRHGSVFVGRERERQRERDREIEIERDRERDRDRDKVKDIMCVCARERKCVCVYVCESVCVCGRERAQTAEWRRAVGIGATFRHPVPACVSNVRVCA